MREDGHGRGGREGRGGRGEHGGRGGRGGAGRSGGRGGPDHEGHIKHRMLGAQTFRRGRAIAFLETLHVRRATLARQLNEPEFEAIKPVISGELKAVDAIIQEFVHVFELRESAESESDDGASGAEGER